MSETAIDPAAPLNCDTVDLHTQTFSFYGNYSVEAEGPGVYCLHECMQTGEQDCLDCGGTGENEDVDTDCQKCDGSGSGDQDDGTCEECDGSGQDEEVDTDCPTCDGTRYNDPDGGDPDAWIPIQSRMWHLPHFELPDDWRDCLSCTTVVQIDGESYLALTGCGMDLSWELAESFIRLGYRPPASIRLPAMCGRGHNERDQAIAEICRESKRILMRWMENGIEDIDRAVTFGVEHEAEIAQRLAEAGTEATA